jgi:hypothetical protein
MNVGAIGACPACGAAVDDVRFCVMCGLDLEGDDAAALRDLTGRLAAVDARLGELHAERRGIEEELGGRRWAATGGAARVTAPRTVVEAPVWAPPGATSPPQPPRAEWSVERIRTLLLWLGASLLALAGLAFTAVTWTRLDDTGRAMLLVTATVGSGALAAAFRTRLPATADAFTALTIALAVIDWQAARRAGIAGDMSGAAWWAIGCVAVSAIAFGLGRIAGRGPATAAIAVLLPAAGVLVVASTAGALWSASLGLALVAAAIVTAERAVTRREAGWCPALLRAEAGAVWVVAAPLAGVAATGHHSVGATLGPVAAILALGLAPAAAVAGSRLGTSLDLLLRALVVAAPIGALVTLGSPALDVEELLTLAALLGASAMVLASLVSARWQSGAAAAGAAALLPGLIAAVSVTLVAVLGPAAWLGHAWSGDLDTAARAVVDGPETGRSFAPGWAPVLTLLLAALVSQFGRFPTATGGNRPNWARVIAGAAFVLLAAVLAPLSADSTVLVACTVAAVSAATMLVGSALVDRRRPSLGIAVCALALIPALPAIGWAAVTRPASIAGLATALVATAIASALARSDEMRGLHAFCAGAAAVALAAVITSVYASSTASGFVAAAAAGSLLAIGSAARTRRADGVGLELAGALGLVLGTATAASSPTWLAAALTVAVPLLAIAALNPDRRALYALGAGAAALGATWSWLAAAGVELVEAYTLPAAALALAAGLAARRGGRAGSWAAFGPAIAIAGFPTLALAVGNDDVTRAVVVGVASAVLVLVGSRARLQAPLVLGAGALVVLGIDTLAPAAARLPRWLVLATVGAVLLWVGATVEQRRDDARQMARRFLELG